MIYRNRSRRVLLVKENKKYSKNLIDAIKENTELKEAAKQDAEILQDTININQVLMKEIGKVITNHKCLAIWHSKRLMIWIPIPIAPKKKVNARYVKKLLRICTV